MDLQTERVERTEAILALLKGEAHDRDAAEWRAVRELVEHIDAQRPRQLAFPAMLEGVTLEQLREAIAIPEAEDRPPYAHTFSAYRAEVYRLEAHNASRLGVVLGALKRIAALRERGFDAATLSRFEAVVHAHLKRVWQLVPPEFRSEEEWRTWPMHATRRYDLLPRSWRAL